jgi:voltage-gated potassium channel Kch
MKNLSLTIADQHGRTGDADREPVSVDEQRQFALASRWVERAVGSNRILLYLSGATMVLSFAAGFVVHLVDERDFATVGDGVWWAVVTFTTVGYGDIVPTTALGRTVASLVMVFGITFIAIVTALVTSALVTQDQRRRQALEAAAHEPVHVVLARIERRLDALERRGP